MSATGCPRGDELDAALDGRLDVSAELGGAGRGRRE